VGVEVGPGVVLAGVVVEVVTWEEGLASGGLTATQIKYISKFLKTNKQTKQNILYTMAFKERKVFQTADAQKTT
jgi:hypothetical protein